MKSQKKTITAVLFTLSCLMCFHSAQPAYTGEDNGPSSQDMELLEKLEESMAEISTVQADFVQEKELAVLERTLVIKGSIALKAPEKLAWLVDKPVRYRMIIRGATLKQWDEDTDRVQEMDLDRNPAYRALFQQMTAWYSGKYIQLLEHYAMEVESENPIVLRFTPLPDTMSEDVIDRLTVTFREDERYIEKLEIREANDSISTLRFRDVLLNEEICEETWEARPADN